MTITPNDDFRALSIRQAAMLTKLSRDTIRAAMKTWTESRGRRGLRWMQLNERRLVRQSALREWFAARENEARYVW